MLKGKNLDLRVDRANGEYQVIASDNRIVKTFKYKIGSETSRGIAHGKANVFRHELYAKLNVPVSH